MEKENTTINEAMDNMEEMSMEQAMESHTVMNIRPGQVLDGKVIKVTPDSVFVNINYMSDGIVPKNEWTSDENEDLTATVKEGDAVKVAVVKIKDGEGNVLLSKKRADADKNIDVIEKALAENTPIRAKVKEAIKGGLRVDLMGISAFMPASLAAEGYIPDLSVLNGKEFDVLVTEFDRHKRKAVVSRKELDKKEKAEAKKNALENLKEGDTVEGTVTKLMNYGAFIDIGGVEGLAHISDLSWNRIKHPSEVVKEGDKVSVVITKINNETGKINLSLKTKESDPWTKVDNYTVGQEVTGKVTNIIQSGAFVEIEPGVEGYLHISEIANEKIEKVEDKLSKGQEVTVRVKEINKENRRLSLTMREGEIREPRRERSEKFNAKFERGEKSEKTERAPRAERSERSERPRREKRSFNNTVAKDNGPDRGYQDKTENLTIGDLFGDLKSKLNFGKDE